MDSSRDDRLTATLEELRPEPRPEFAAELDRRAAAGFPRRSRLAALRERLQMVPPREMLLPIGAAAALLLVVAVALTATGGGSEGGSEDGASSGGEVLNFLSMDVDESAAPSRSTAGLGEPSAGRRDGAATRASNRKVERSAELDLAVPPDRLSDAASEALAIVQASNGIVMRSSLERDSDNPDVAFFELLIPSGRADEALAEFSELGDVLSSEDRTADITAPTVGTAEHLREARARIEGLLSQLAAASTEAERETVEAELRGERRQVARLRARLADLKRSANLSRFSVAIFGWDAGGWSIGDAIDDAGRVLSIAAAVAIVALAVLVPLALIALLVLLARRAWLRRARARALS